MQHETFICSMRPLYAARTLDTHHKNFECGIRNYDAPRKLLPRELLAKRPQLAELLGIGTDERSANCFSLVEIASSLQIRARSTDCGLFGVICDRHTRLNKSVSVRPRPTRPGPASRPFARPTGQYTELDNLIWGRASFVRLGTAICYRKHFRATLEQDKIREDKL